MLYSRLILTLLAAAIVSASPQDVDALEGLPEELTIVDGDGPLDLAADPPPPLTEGHGECNSGQSTSSDPKRCAAGLYCFRKRNDPADKTCQIGCDDPEDCSGNTPVCNTRTNKCEAAPVSCNAGNEATKCLATEYCKDGTCTTGCRADGLTTTAACPLSTGKIEPVACKDHKCQYSDCPSQTCVAPKTCETVGLLKLCKSPTPTVTKCNAYKKCATGFYCHKKECKEGCDGGKWSKCKDKNSAKGTCDGKHKCFVPVGKTAGYPCKKDSNCATGYKCVHDHGHDSHCHKVAKKTEACNQKVLFPDVCDKHLVCKKGKCEEEKHKKNKYD